jgi:hypothetical protein
MDLEYWYHINMSYLVGYNAMYSGESQLALQRNVLLPFSRLKSKPIKKTT